MAYTKQTWSSNDLVTAEKLNHMEDGIVNATNNSYTISIATSDWVGSSSYTYTYTATGITANTNIGYEIKSGIDYIQSAITVTTSTDTLTFSTAVKPTGTIELIIYTI